MAKSEILGLKDSATIPTEEAVKKALGDSYSAYATFQNALAGLELEQQWQWYTPHKAWYARGQYKWTTPRGTAREKTIYWLYPFEGYFNVAVWFLEKNRMDLLGADVSDVAKKLIRETANFGKMQTFPVAFEVLGEEPLADIYELIKCKKKMEA